MKRQKENADYDVNGVSISSLTVNQDGNLEVEFDLPVQQTTASWRTDLRGSRTFDIYEDKELEALCRQLFQLVRDRVRKPDPERLAVHCDRCATSPCCRKYNVLLREADIERLAGGLEMSKRAFRERYTEPAIDWCGDFERQLTADEDADGEEKCIFLEQVDGGQWRCSVYEHRPKICRDFDMNTCDDFVPLDEIEVLDAH